MPLNRDDADSVDRAGGPWPAGLRVWLVGIVVKFPDEGRIVRFGRADAESESATVIILRGAPKRPPPAAMGGRRRMRRR
jgi:hypothetical protein